MEMDQGKGLTVDKTAGMSNSNKSAQKNKKPTKKQHEFEYDVTKMENTTRLPVKRSKFCIYH